MDRYNDLPRRYANAKELAYIMGLSYSTVRQRLKLIRNEMGGRYNQYAIVGNLIAIPVFVDAHKYHELLEDPRTHDVAPAFDEELAKAYL